METQLTHLALEINSHCNRKCSHCPNSLYERPVKYLSIRIIEKALNQCHEMGTLRECTFNNFNEPLLDPRIVDIVKLSRSILGSGVKIYINTNGDFLTRRLYDDLMSAGCNDFNITDYDGKCKINFHYVNPIKAVPLFNRGGLLWKIDKPLVKSCSKPYQNLVVDYTGKVVLCCADYLGSVVCGDLNEQSVREIWEGPVLSEYRRLLPDRSKLKLCEACDGP